MARFRRYARGFSLPGNTPKLNAIRALVKYFTCETNLPGSPKTPQGILKPPQTKKYPVAASKSKAKSCAKPKKTAKTKTETKTETKPTTKAAISTKTKAKPETQAKSKTDPKRIANNIAANIIALHGYAFRSGY